MNGANYKDSLANSGEIKVYIATCMGKYYEKIMENFKEFTSAYHKDPGSMSVHLARGHSLQKVYNS